MSPTRREVLGLVAALAASPRITFAQGSEPLLVAAIIGAPGPDDPAAIAWTEAVRHGLQEEGWIDGENIHIEARFTAGLVELTERYVAELLAMEPDIFVTGTTRNAVAVDTATQAIPLVFVAVPDPIGNGLVDSYPRPGGHATGITHLEPSVGGKMVEMLLQIAPATTKVVLLTNPDTVSSDMRPFIVEAADQLGVAFMDADVHVVEEVGPVVDAIAREPGVGLVLQSNNWVHNNASYFVEAINRNHIPAVYPAHRIVDAGGLIGVGVEIVEMFRFGGAYAGRILSGADPAELPVRAAPYSTVVNLRTAAEQGIEIPLSVMATAGRFIE